MRRPNPKDTNENEIEVGDGVFSGFNKYGPSRSQLPIQDSKTEILYAVENYSCTVVIAETGSGKTTQIPQFLVETGYALNGKCIAITVPRRMAAVSVAQRVAEEMDTNLGEEVGYNIRFEDRTSPNTIVKFLTDGMLVREMMQDPLLEKYSVIMVDDMHERTVYTDIIMGLLKKIRKKRPELKIIISSATLDADRIASFFEGEKKEFKSRIVHVAGRQFPVELHYLKNPCKNYVTKAAELALDIHQKKLLGDVLVFLTGQEEIQAFIDFLTEQSANLKTNMMIDCIPLYGNMPMEAQMAVFAPTAPNTRKIIVSTNIAESSVTIDNIVYVIDSCFVKMKYFDYQTGSESLLITSVSKSSANQRAGRAGRVKPGECYRLCTKQDFEGLYDSSPPEIARTNLANAILQMKCLGIGNLMKFDFLTKPTEESMVRALEILYSLGAIDKSGDLTADVGWKLTELPIEPRLGVALINSAKEEYLCSEEMLKLVAMLSAPSIFYAGRSSGMVIKSKKKLGAKEGDHITLLNIYLRFERIRDKPNQKKFCSEHGISMKSMEGAKRIHTQLTKFMKQHKLKIKTSDDDAELIIKCLATGFFDHVAQKQPDGSYRGIRGKEVLHLHPNSLMHVIYPVWVMYHEVVKTGKSYMREVSTIDHKWLTEVAPHFYEDTKLKQIEAKRNREISEHNRYDAQKKVKKDTPAPSKAEVKPKKSTFVISDMDYMDSD